jgi:cytochrome c-type biogenesis protein CcmH/NrfG
MLRGEDFLGMSDEELVERTGDKMLYGEQAKAALAVRNARRIADSLEAASGRMEQGVRAIAEAEGRFRESVSEAAEAASRASRVLSALAVLLLAAALLLAYSTWRLQRETKALRSVTSGPQGRVGASADAAD